jgi:hypothetical protein
MCTCHKAAAVAVATAVMVELVHYNISSCSTHCMGKLSLLLLLLLLILLLVLLSSLTVRYC